MGDDYRQLQISKTRSTQSYCYLCDLTFRRTGRYPKCCPGMARYIVHYVRGKMKSETRKALAEHT